MPSDSVWIGDLRISQEVAAKIREKHNLTPEQVREATLAGAHREARWHMHEIYGRRLLVWGTTYERDDILATLAPLNEDDGLWELRTARRLPR